MKIYNALILNDYPGKHYAGMVYRGDKILETRMRMFKYEGDLIICCGNKSVTGRAGKALCLVHFGQGRPMVPADEKDAKIEWAKGRIVYPLTNFRYFNKLFDFKYHRVSGSWQGIFQIALPDELSILKNESTITI